MKCHFVPQSYLRRFCNRSGKLECFDFHREFTPTTPTAVRRTAQIEDWYVLRGIEEISGASFIEEKQIERDYQLLFENDLTPALDRLESRALLAKDKEVLARFVAFQLHRVPISREYYQRMQNEENDTSDNKEARQIRNAQILLGHINTAFSSFALEKYLLNSMWMLIRSKGGKPFLTSDNPVHVSGHPQNMNTKAFIDQHKMRDCPSS